MKEEFYCLPLRKKVKSKITSVVKKKSYSLKSVHKVGDKSYNLNKVCSKARAEEVAAALGIEIEHSAAAETLAVPEDSFIPDGTGSVIGQNTAGMKTAIPATEETPTANTTPFHSESDDDKIGPMSMSAETLSKTSCCCGATAEKPCACMTADKPMECSAVEPKCACYSEQKDAESFPKSRSKSDEDEVLEGAVQDEVSNAILGPAAEMAAETFGVSYAIEPDHWLRLQAHPEWQSTRGEVNVERQENFWVVTSHEVTADDLLELIIDTADTELTEMAPVNSKGIGKGVTLGIGVLGIAASIMLLRRFNKEE
jgi:hypothetical protein